MKQRTGPKPLPEHERFWPKVVFDANDAGCWEWQGAASSAGYGKIMTGSRSDGSRRYAPAHRWAYEFCVGPIPDGLQLDHLCRNPSCVNPDHLEPVTNRENTLRGNAPIRMREANPGAAFQSAKTHCPQGHIYDDANTRWTSATGNHSATRHCRTCNKAQDTARHQRDRAATALGIRS